jgi:hypothetical protein
LELFGSTPPLFFVALYGVDFALVLNITPILYIMATQVNFKMWLLVVLQLIKLQRKEGVLSQRVPRLLKATEKVRRFGLGDKCRIVYGYNVSTLFNIYRTCFKPTELTTLRIQIY